MRIERVEHAVAGGVLDVVGAAAVVLGGFASGSVPASRVARPAKKPMPASATINVARAPIQAGASSAMPTFRFALSRSSSRIR